MSFSPTMCRSICHKKKQLYIFKRQYVNHFVSGKMYGLEKDRLVGCLKTQTV